MPTGGVKTGVSRKSSLLPETFICASPGLSGRLFISFHDTTLENPTQGDRVGWVGTYDDIVKGREGQYRVRPMHNTYQADCAYPGVERLPDGTFVVITYGHRIQGEQPFIVSVRCTLKELAPGSRINAGNADPPHFGVRRQLTRCLPAEHIP
jgi:hypothetical protein